MKKGISAALFSSKNLYLGAKTINFTGTSRNKTDGTNLEFSREWKQL